MSMREASPVGDGGPNDGAGTNRPETMRVPPRKKQHETGQPQNTTAIPVFLNEVVYIVFDLETTGLDTGKAEITQIAVEILQADGSLIEGAKYCSYVKPTTVSSIDPYVTYLTGIDDRTLAGAPQFKDVGRNFLLFIQNRIASWADQLSEENKTVKNVVFVAHYGRSFDVPILLNSMKRHGLEEEWKAFATNFDPLLYLDTHELASMTVINNYGMARPTDNKLATLYKYCSGKDLGAAAHHADADVAAATVILTYNAFWRERNKYIKAMATSGTYYIARIPRAVTVAFEREASSSDTTEDSSSDAEDSSSSDTEDSSSDTEDSSSSDTTEDSSSDTEDSSSSDTEDSSSDTEEDDTPSSNILRKRPRPPNPRCSARIAGGRLGTYSTANGVCRSRWLADGGK